MPSQETHPPSAAAHHAPATLRNREPILSVLRDVLPPAGTVLEIASGSGEHATYFAQQLAPLLWQPTDYSAEAVASIAAWRDAEDGHRPLPPRQLDVTASAKWWERKWRERFAVHLPSTNRRHIQCSDLPSKR